MRLSIEQLNKLPQEVIEDVKGTLKAYDEVHRVFENGKYQVSCGVMLKAKYGNDFKVIGDVYAEDIFSLEEMIVNYIEEFMGYPIVYKGTRDYKMLRKLEELRHEGKVGEIALDGEGNAILKGWHEMKF